MCEDCDNGEGGCIYPYYGVVRRHPDVSKTGSVIGSTVIDPRSKWPSNFAPDEPAAEDGGGLGVYTHCLKCGAPNTPTERPMQDEYDATRMIGKTVAAVVRPPYPDGGWCEVTFTDGTVVRFQGCWTNDRSDSLDVYEIRPDSPTPEPPCRP